MRPDVHAPDGGIGCGSLCGELAGDTTTIEGDVTCPDCLDAIEMRPPGDFDRLTQHTIELRNTRIPTGTR